MNKKRIKLAVSLFALAALAVIVSIRWNAWFGNPDEPSYTLSEKPQRELLTISPEGSNSRMVSWFSVSEDDGEIEFFSKDTASSNADTIRVKAMRKVCNTRSGQTHVFYATMPNLLSAETYIYRVKNGPAIGRWHSMSMPSEPSEGFTFINLGDIQDPDSAPALETKRLYAEIMNRHPECAFVLQNGDFIERPMDKYWDLAIRSLDSFATKIPFVAIAGNHEYLKGVSREIDNRFEAVFPYFQTTPDVPGAQASFVYGDCRFLLLDSNNESWNMPSQRSWLKDVLSNGNEKWTIAALHHPLYSIRGNTRNIFPKMAFRSILEESADLILQGHEHGYARKVVEHDGKACGPLYIVSYFSAKAYPLKFQGDYKRFGSYYRYYQVFRVKGDTLEMSTYNEKHELYDHVIIVKNGNEKSVTDLADHTNVNVDMAEWFRKEKGDKKADKAAKIINEWKREHGIK